MRQDLQDIKALLRGKISVAEEKASSPPAAVPAADMPKEAPGDEAGVIRVDSGWARQSTGGTIKPPRHHWKDMTEIKARWDKNEARQQRLRFVEGNLHLFYHMVNQHLNFMGKF